MAKIETWFTQDLNTAVKPHSFPGEVFNNDSLGNLIGVEVTKDGEPFALTGSVNGYCVLSNGETIPVAGNRSGNKASIVLPQTAYSVRGVIKITLKLTNGNETTTLLQVVGAVDQSVTGNMVNPGSVVQDWSQQIATALQELQDAENNFVRVDTASQGLTETKKSNGRTNINAASVSDVDDLKNEINASGTVPISGYKLYDGHITNDGKWGQVGNNKYYVVPFPVSNGDKIKFEVTGQSRVAFVTGFNTPVNNESLLFSAQTGYTAKFDVASNTLMEFTSPSDAKYMVIERIWNSGDVNIIVLNVNGYDYTTPLDSQIVDMKKSMNIQNMGVVSDIAQGVYSHEALSISTGSLVGYTASDLIALTNIVCFDKMVAISPKTGYAFRIFQYNGNGEFVRYYEVGASQTANVFAAIPKGLPVRLQFFKEARTAIEYDEVLNNYNIRYIDSDIYADQIIHPGYRVGTIYNDKKWCTLNYYSTTSTGSNGKTFAIAKSGTYKQLVSRFSDSTTYVNNSTSIDVDYTLPKNEYYAVAFRRADSADLTVDDIAEIFGNVVKIREPETTIEKIYATLENKTIGTTEGNVIDAIYNYRISSTELLTADNDIGISTWTDNVLRVFLYDSQGAMTRYWDGANSKAFAVLKGERFRLTFYKDGSTAIQIPTFVMSNFSIKYSVCEEPKEVFADLISNGGNLKLVGDSITQGVNGTGFAQDGDHIIGNYYRNPNGYCYANLLEATLESTYGLTVVNNACRGTATDFLLTNWGKLISSTDDVILCMYGTNDRGLVPSKDTSLENYKRFRAMASASGQRIVFMASIPAGLRNETNETQNYQNIYYHMEDVDRNINIATDGKYVSLFDICSAWISDDDISLTNYLDSYELHPNDDLYYKMFVWVCKALGIAPKIKNATW